MKYLAFAVAAAILNIGSAGATVITFDNDATVNPFTGTYTQSGYTINYASGVLRLVNNNVNFGDALVGGSASGGSFDLTRVDSGLFSIQSFFGGSGLPNTAITFTLLGYLAGANTYSETFTATGTTPRTANLLQFSPTTTVNTFDRVNFSMQSGQSSPIIDNINLTEIAAPTPPVTTPDPTPPITSAVPEPATWATMMLGFAVVGGTMRRRRHGVRVSFA